VASAVDEYPGSLLRTLAESLDVREIFARISVEARRIVPHDFLMLGLLSDDHQRVRVIALSGDLPVTPGHIVLPEALRGPIEGGGDFVLNDIALSADGARLIGKLRMPGSTEVRVVEYEAQPFFRSLKVDSGIRSTLRVAVRLRGGVVGGLIFCATGPDSYDDADVAHARQVADLVALAVAHQRLADEEMRSAEARSRASQLEVRVRRLTEELERGRHPVLGKSAAWLDVLSQAAKVAATEATVLLCGESGTGKEVVARYIHRASPRASGPFIALNCAALPEQLLESELFGHEKGAFTGALAAHPGKIEQASGGVLFLDEVGEMTSAVQAKLLRVLQEREYQRLGSIRTIHADIRVLAATNRNLKDAVAKGAFREDLYYRLAVFDITLPPLRDRVDDIVVLADAFVAEIGRSIGRPAVGIAAPARSMLAAYAWPGNVRELRNVVERALILCDGGTIASAHLPNDVVSASQASRASTASPSSRPAGALEATERDMIAAALARAGNNKSKAARLLGVTRAQLRSRLTKYGIADT